MTSVGLEDVLAWLREAAARIEEQREYLTQLDSAIGDADHGINMSRGFKAALERLDSNPPEDIAGPILFLCSDLARHLTGEVLNVNGGSVLCG